MKTNRIVILKNIMEHLKYIYDYDQIFPNESNFSIK